MRALRRAGARGALRHAGGAELSARDTLQHHTFLFPGGFWGLQRC